jgi:D-xylose reductase
MPAVGFGTWKKSTAETARVVTDALEIGYRLIDSAADYGNEVETGKGIATSVAAGHCTREDLWVTSKLWNTYHRKEHVRPACEKTLKDLGLDYLDLYLVHFPIAMRYVDFDDRYPPGWIFDPQAAAPKIEFDSVPLAETWRAMEALVTAGMVRQIGISNFNSALLTDLMAYSSIKPAVLQIESHPLLAQEALIRLATQYGIAITAFSPLGAQSYISLGSASDADSALTAAAVVEAAERTRKTPAQVVLRWGVQRGTAIIPSSTSPDRLRENIDLFDFELNDDEMTAISALDQKHRFNDPAKFCEPAFGTFCTIYD